jgi:hypothetical protein
VRQTISELSASGFGVADLVTHNTPIAFVPEAFTSMTPVASPYVNTFENKFNRLLRCRPTFFFVTQLWQTMITTCVENDSEKNAIDFFVVTRSFFSSRHFDTQRSQRALKTIELRHSMDDPPQLRACHTMEPITRHSRVAKDHKGRDPLCHDEGHNFMTRLIPNRKTTTIPLARVRHHRFVAFCDARDIVTTFGRFGSKSDQSGSEPVFCHS